MITSRNSLVFFLAFCAGSLQVCAQAPELGETEFPNSGAADAQESFLRGLLLLHSFEYEDAREAFGEARRTDPDFVMAYWGEAMSHNHPIWFTQNTKAARGVLEALAPTREERLAKAPTARERNYLHAVDVLFFADEDKQGRDLAYQEVMQELHAAYPDDLDAASFYALSILGSSHGGRDYGLHMKAAAVAEEVFASNPRHPGAAHHPIPFLYTTPPPPPPPGGGGRAPALPDPFIRRPRPRARWVARRPRLRGNRSFGGPCPPYAFAYFHGHGDVGRGGLLQ